MSNFLDRSADQSKQRTFDLSDVLTVTTGALISTRQVDGLYDIMGYVTGDESISTIGLAMMADSAKQTILQQHPQLASVTFPDIKKVAASDREKFISDWLSKQKATFGETLSISPAKISLQLSLDEQIDYVKGINPNIQVHTVGLEPRKPQKKPPTRKPGEPRT